jgi:glycosyltransferase involved in cell wall biosynthesis
VGRLASRIIAVSEYDRQLALKHAIAPPDTIVTIHNGMPAVDPSLQASPELTPPRLVMVARFESQKDQATLVQALSGLNQYEWSLDLVGDGPQRSAVEAAVGEAGLEGRVRFLGFRNDVPELLSQSQLFVLSSHWEGFPRTIVEAMRAGLPVIASDVGGVSEAVIDGETGCVVPPADHIALRRALEQLICDAGLREEMGARGRQRFEQQLTFDRMVEATAQLYRQLV